MATRDTGLRHIGDILRNHPNPILRKACARSQMIPRTTGQTNAGLKLECLQLMKEGLREGKKA